MSDPVNFPSSDCGRKISVKCERIDNNGPYDETKIRKRKITF